jgi:hypothetical protein
MGLRASLHSLVKTKIFVHAGKRPPPFQLLIDCFIYWSISTIKWLHKYHYYGYTYLSSIPPSPLKNIATLVSNIFRVSFAVYSVGLRSLELSNSVGTSCEVALLTIKLSQRRKFVTCSWKVPCPHLGQIDCSGRLFVVSGHILSPKQIRSQLIRLISFPIHCSLITVSFNPT